MTIVNIISCELYIKSGGFKARLQPYGLAFVFLVLLYNCSSALVIYWTFNNLFNLIKNKFMDSSPKIFSWILLIIAILVFYYDGYINNLAYSYITLVLLTVSLPYLLLFIVYKYVKDNYFKGKETLITSTNKFDILAFSLCASGLVLLQAFIIPIGLMNSDLPLFVTELESISNIVNILTKNLAIILGFYFILGFGTILLIKKDYKTYFIIGFISFFIHSIINYLFFFNNLGMLDCDLVFPNIVQVEMALGNIYNQIFNALLFVLIFAFIIFLLKKIQSKYVLCIIFTILLSEIIVSIIYLFDFKKNTNFINNYYKTVNKLIIPKKLELSKGGKNVIIVFLDRFVGGILPLILDEKPEMKKVYSGFVFYPNTVSFYWSTILGYPPTIGGYEYIPLVLDKDNRLLPEKWMEATLMLPILFKNNNFSSTVVDPIGDFDYNMQFYKEDSYQNLYTSKGLNYIKLSGRFNSLLQKDERNEKGLLNYFCKRLYMYSFFKISSNYYKKILYEDGNYLLIRNVDSLNIYTTNKSFISAYSSLLFLKDITNINSTTTSTFALINSDLPHNMHYLQYPDYEYSEKITNIGINRFKNEESFKSYHTAMASILLVGKYLDYLKENGVYDNSRIIIVADHGNHYLTLPNSNNFQNSNITPFNPILMVKDFNQRFELKKDYTFMTNADTPFIATNNLIDNPINPFTGKKLSMEEKSKGIDIYMDINFWNASQFKTNRVILDKNPKIKHVRDNIFEESNWSDVKYTKNE